MGNKKKRKKAKPFKATDVYLKVKPIGGVSGNQKSINTYKFGRKLKNNEIKAIRKLFDVFDFCDRITSVSCDILFGLESTNKIQYTLNIGYIKEYLKSNNV